MKTRLWTFAVWALAAGTALYWGLKLFVAPTPVPPRTPVAAQAAVPRGDLTRLLGVDAPAPVAAAPTEAPPDARFQLIGVLSPKSRQAAAEGVALIAVDGKPAKAYRVGAVVEGQTVLQAVGARGAQLGPRGGATLVALNLTAPAAAATGVLAGVGGAANAPAQAAPQAAPPGVPSPVGFPNQAPQPNQQGARRVLPPPPAVPVTQPFMTPNRLPGQGPGDMPTQ
jgi:general secretion pathway protein C